MDEAPSNHRLWVQRLRELAILFALFVGPSVVSPGGPATHDGLSPLVAMTMRNSLLVLLIAYLLDIQGEVHRVWRRPTWASFGSAVPTAFLVGILLSAIGLAVAAAPVVIEVEIMGRSEPRLSTAAYFASMLQDPLTAAVLVLAMISVGLIEELLFRGYLLLRLEQIGCSNRQAVVLASACFALGHVYQGPWGFAMAFLSGTALGALWFRRPQLGAFAIGHAAYNTGAILVATWYS